MFWYKWNVELLSIIWIYYDLLTEHSSSEKHEEDVIVWSIAILFWGLISRFGKIVTQTEKLLKECCRSVNLGKSRILQGRGAIIGLLKPPFMYSVWGFSPAKSRIRTRSGAFWDNFQQVWQSISFSHQKIFSKDLCVKKFGFTMFYLFVGRYKP